jgi:LGFP repeat-containing protein
MTAIDDKYAALGGSGGFLGQPTSPEQALPDGRGRHRDYQHGLIYWSPETGAHAVYGSIGQKWAELGRESGFLGYPVTDETGTPDGHGRYNHFQHGSIYWTLDSGAYEIHGLIREKWASLGWERSFLGYPLTDETSTPDRHGRYNHFQGGSIYWTPETNAHEVHGAIRDKWSALGWERSFLGYPVTDELATRGPGRFSRFQGGAIHWTPYTGPREVRGVGSHYVVSLDGFHIDNTRSVHNDTDHVNFAMKIGSQAMPESQTRDTGDVNNGDHLVGLCFGPLLIDPAAPIVFNYQILNSSADGGKIKAVFDDVAKALAGSSAVTGNWWAAAALAVARYAAGFIMPGNCDGPVAVDQISVTGADLINWTQGNGIYAETRFYPGTDSNVGCGSNSRYFVTWSVIRL